MPASQTHPLPPPPPPPPPPTQPLPLPPPPLSLPSPSSSSTSTVPRLRHHHRRLASSSSSSSSSAASIFSPSPSPSRRSWPSRAAVSDTTTTASSSVSVVVPFSWELHPGIPKNGLASSSAAAASEPALPLPPPIRASPPRRRRQHHRRRRSDGVPARSGTSDPFTAAFAECTREREDDATDDFRPALAAATPSPVVSGRRRSDAGSSEHRWWLAGGSGFVGFLDLYGCKSAMAVADAAILARRRPVVARSKPSRATRRDK